MAVASENWVPLALVQQWKKAGVNFSGNFAVVPGYTYTLSTGTNLTRTNGWTSLLTTNGTGSVVTTAFTNTTSDKARFYKLKRTATP
jgi:hypothetical protein